MINHNGKGYEKEYIYVTLNHFAIQQKLTQQSKSLYVNKINLKIQGAKETCWEDTTFGEHT